MALRFRKSFKLAPGIRMNVSGSGASWTLGPRGANVGIGKRGTYLNTGIPGTGLYAREKISAPRATQKSSPSPETTSFSISISISDDGTIRFTDKQGNGIAEHLITAAKMQQGDAIRNLIQQKCDEINDELESVGNLHLFTPSPLKILTYTPRVYEIEKPQQPTVKPIGLICRLFKSQRDRAEAEHQKGVLKYQNQLSEWETQRFNFDECESHRKQLIEKEVYGNLNAMEQVLEETLNSINWPRETDVSAEILNDGNIVFIDFDFPEIEDMPNKRAVAPLKGYKLSVKELSMPNLQKLYMYHIHGIAFRTIGEVFRALPKSEEIVFSGYSQRADKTTGQIYDEYLISVRVKRNEWQQINFDNLESLDVVEALQNFELRRSMTKTGVFKSISPFTT